MAAGKRSRLSSGVTVVCGTSFGHRQPLEGSRKRVRLNKSHKELAVEKLRHQTQLACECHLHLFLICELKYREALSFEDREDLIRSSENDVDMANDAWVDENDIAFSRPPPGEEGFFSSHAGGEIRLQDIFLDTLAEQSVFSSTLSDHFGINNLLP